MGVDLLSEPLTLLSNDEIDAIGEILNISMGSAATAISTLLDKQVNITIPKVMQQKFANVNYLSLEPAMIVKIKYVEGISGSNVMVFRQRDMQVILNLLMGNEEEPEGPIEFDELSMSAACEVMNQMMGSSATALSEFLGKKIDISTPEATILDETNTFEAAMEVDAEESIVSVSFNIEIVGVMTSEFISVMKQDLARMIVAQAMGDQGTEEEEAPAAPAPMVPPPAPSAPAAAPQPPSQPAAMGMPAQPAMPPQAAAPSPAMPAQPPQMPAPGMMPAEGMPAYPYGYPPYPMYPYGGYPMPGQPSAPGQPGVLKQPDVNVQNAKFPNFGGPQPVLAAPASNGNMELLMNVPLSVSVEIGKTKRKIRDIIDFNQGAVIELEKQAGAPVDIVVNGQLIARGDVVVINDNFGVRITEIIGTKDLIDSLGNGN
ncbi:MAG: flagellar motor switch phosphatase FliY [Provencibacterium sp.]|jgi:flagellar motor switch protein FliN/FliY|nr:flagellar motor switch phosphatase FliY [Provencibacterium sp.]